MRQNRAVLVFACLTLALLPRAEAGTAGGLKGVVLDRQGGPLAGAVITIRNPGLGLARGAVSDAKGEFRVLPLPAAAGYSLTVQLPGMATITVSDIDVEADHISGVPVVLSPSTQVQEHVRVTHLGDVVDLSDTTTQTHFTSEFLNALPILGRNYQDVLVLAPGVSDLDGDGNPNIHGARDTDVMTLVDGVSTVDPVTGRVGQQLNIDSIQEIEIKTSGAPAEFGRAQGGYVNIVTKSGGNEFAGDFKFFWRGHLLDGDGAGHDEPMLHGGTRHVGIAQLNFNDYKPFFSLGGPIVRDAAWFFVTAEYIQEEEPVNALSQVYITGTREMRLFNKLSWDVTPGQKIALSLTWDPQEYTNLGLNAFTSPETGYAQRTGGLNLVLRETAIFSPNVFLETTGQWFESRPELIPNLDPDSNHNGILFVDRNRNGLVEATEIDPGEDWDDDGAWDVSEDLNMDFQFNKGEDLDRDGRWNLRIGCEGETREDQDCDGFLDDSNEDLNANGIMDPGEDIDRDWVLENAHEDRNRNHVLDDRPFPDAGDRFLAFPWDGVLVDPPWFYPYTRPRPLAGDRTYLSMDMGALSHTEGPFFFDYTGSRGRVTLKQDLTVFVPEWHGQHDLKLGGVLEREHYSQETDRRPVFVLSRRSSSTPPLMNVGLSGEVSNSASSGTLGLYVQDTYKPFPGLSLGLGLRLDREATESFGYTPFDPAPERALYNRLRALGPRGEVDDRAGNADGIRSLGYCSDPIFSMPGFSCPQNNFSIPIVAELAGLDKVANSRLIQHHSGVSLLAVNLAKLYPEAAYTDPISGQLVIDLDVLRQRGQAAFQRPEAFRLTNNNLAPRLFASWDPGAGGRTKLFVNWSRFYDKLFLQSIVGEEGPDTIYRSYRLDPNGVSDSGIPDNGIGKIFSQAPPSVNQVDRGLQTPFVDEWTAGIERELLPETSIKITYISRKYRMQLQDRDVNHVQRLDESGRPLDVIGHPPDEDRGEPGLIRFPDGRPDLYVQNFFFNQVLRLDNSNSARYQGIEVQLSRRLRHNLQLEGSYTYSRAVGAAESFDSVLGDDPSVVRNEFGYLDYDQRHVVKLNAAAYLAGDWQLGTAMSWSSGTRYSLLDTFVALDDFDYPQFRTFYGYIKDGGYVSMRRNTERNKAILNIDLRAQKAFVLGKVNSRLFISVQNLLNRDDLTILGAVPGGSAIRPNTQLDAVRRFGRRYEVGFHFAF